VHHQTLWSGFIILCCTGIQCADGAFTVATAYYAFWLSLQLQVAFHRRHLTDYALA
jgi:hypothetical protein